MAVNILRREQALALIERIARVDLSAAQYLLSLYDAVPREGITVVVSRGADGGDCIYKLASEIGMTFRWAGTPQGGPYWSNISQELRRTER